MPDALTTLMHALAPWAVGTISGLVVMILRKIQTDTSKMADRIEHIAEHLESRLTNLGRRHDDHYQALSARVARMEGQCEVIHNRMTTDHNDDTHYDDTR